MTSCKICGTKAALLSGFLTILIVISFLGLPFVAVAAEITYIGDKNKLQETPSWFYEANEPCLFPGTEAAPLSSGNKIIVIYDFYAPGVTNPEVVLGGLSRSDDSANNEIVLLNGRVEHSVLGGWSESGRALENTVSVKGGYIGDGLTGGWSKHGSAIGNTVTISGGDVHYDIYGGRGATSIVGNSVTVSGKAMCDRVFGGFADIGAVTGNLVTISDRAICGLGYGGFSGKGVVTGNIVTINGGFVDQQAFGGVSMEGNAIDNAVLVSGGTIDNGVCGGSSANGSAEGNVVTVSGGELQDLVCGGANKSGAGVTGNLVAIDGGNIRGSVIGGWSGAGDAVGNNVVITGGSIDGGVYGGRSEDGDATGNTANISGRPDLVNARIWGGYSDFMLAEVRTGNILNLASAGVSVTGVDNFEFYNFNLPQNLAAGGVMLSVKEAVDFAGAAVEILLPNGIKLKKGDKIALIHSDEGISNAPKNRSCKAQQDGVLYEFSIYTDKDNLWAKVEKISKTAK